MVCAAAVAVIAGAPGAARAAPGDVDGAKAALGDGDRSFQLGRFEDAIQAYERAFSLDPQPAFLFNIGLAHRRQYQIDGKLEHLLRARELYRNYLKLDPASPRRAGVEKVLDELEAQIEEARRGSPGPVAPPSPLPPAPPARARPDAPVLVAPAPSEKAAAPAPPPSSSKTRWLLVVGAAAVAAAAAAIVLAARSSGTPFDGPGVDLTPRR